MKWYEKTDDKKTALYTKIFLERFQDPDGYLWIYDIKRSRCYSGLPERVCVETDLYETKWNNSDILQEEYILQNDIEDIFGKYETEFSSFLRRLDMLISLNRNSHAKICYKEEKEVLYKLVVNLFLRNPKNMKEYEQIIKDEDLLGKGQTCEFCKILDQLGEGNGKSILKAAKRKAILTDEFEGDSFMKRYVNKLSGLQFVFLYAESGTFVLADPPVSMGLDNTTDNPNKECCYLPLSPKVAILFGNYDRYRKNSIVMVKQEIVDDFNFEYVGFEKNKKDLIICSNKEQCEVYAKFIANYKNETD